MTTRKCDIPFCENSERETSMFDHTNITCWTCKKFNCSKCSAQIWKGEWNGEEFYKPKYVLKGLLHQVFKCPHCRASFDRMLPVDEQGNEIKYERRLRTSSNELDDELELSSGGNKE